jgi:hypothetical protein
MKPPLIILNTSLLMLLFSLTGCFSYSFFKSDTESQVASDGKAVELGLTASSEEQSPSDVKLLQPMVFEESIQFSAPDTTLTL